MKAAATEAVYKEKVSSLAICDKWLGSLGIRGAGLERLEKHC
jgi:hypothetical protein